MRVRAARVQSGVRAGAAGAGVDDVLVAEPPAPAAAGARRGRAVRRARRRGRNRPDRGRGARPARGLPRGRAHRGSGGARVDGQRLSRRASALQPRRRESRERDRPAGRPLAPADRDRREPRRRRGARRHRQRGRHRRPDRAGASARGARHDQDARAGLARRLGARRGGRQRASERAPRTGPGVRGARDLGPGLADPARLVPPGLVHRRPARGDRPRADRGRVDQPGARLHARVHGHARPGGAPLVSDRDRAAGRADRSRVRRCTRRDRGSCRLAGAGR